jgi:UDP-glucose 4-epimerase
MITRLLFRIAVPRTAVPRTTAFDERVRAGAVQRALEVPLAGHHHVLLCAAGIAATEPSLMAARFAPSVPVRHSACLQRDPRRALLDCAAAARILGWQPRCTWSMRGPGPPG